MVAGMWWFFTLIMISSYTANLAGKYYNFIQNKDILGAAIFTTSKNTATVKAMYTYLNDVLYKVDIYLYIMYTIFVGVFLSQNCEYISAIAVSLSDALKIQVYI